MDLTEALKVLMLAGVGAAAKTMDVTKSVVDELVKEGTVTMEEGKVLAEQLKEKAAAKRAEAMMSAVKALSPEERAILRVKLDEADAEEAARNAEEDAANEEAAAEAECEECACEAPAEESCCCEEAPVEEKPAEE